VGTTINGAMMTAVFKRMRAVKSANGQPMRLSPTHMVVHPDHEQDAKDFLQSDLQRLAFLSGGSNTNELSNNRWKDSIALVVADELAGVSGVDADKVYFVDSRAGAKPWIIQDGGDIEQIVHTKDDSMYKSTGKVGVRYVLELAVAAALPHAIIRVDLTP
jgi:hypothetical protein